MLQPTWWYWSAHINDVTNLLATWNSPQPYFQLSSTMGVHGWLWDIIAWRWEGINDMTLCKQIQSCTWPCSISCTQIHNIGLCWERKNPALLCTAVTLLLSSHHLKSFHISRKYLQEPWSSYNYMPQCCLFVHQLYLIFFFSCTLFFSQGHICTIYRLHNI